MSTPTETKESPFMRVKFAGDAETGVFEGYASVFGNVDSHGDMVMPGAFAGSIAEHKSAGTSPVMLWMHKADAPIGKWVELVEDDIGLHVRGQLNLKTTAGREAYAHIMDGDVGGLSIGFFIVQAKKLGAVRQVVAAKLVEISVVTVPSNERTRIKLDTKGDLETLLTKSGLAKEAARRVAFGGWPALSAPDHSNAVGLAAEIARATAQLKAL